MTWQLLLSRPRVSPPRCAARRASRSPSRSVAVPRASLGAGERDEEAASSRARRAAYVAEFEGVRVGAHTARGSRHAAAQDRWQVARSPSYGLWLALFYGRGLGGSRVAERARQQLLPLCELGAPARGFSASSRRDDLLASYDQEEDLLRALTRGFIACEDALSTRYAKTHTAGGLSALVASILELPPPPPPYAGSVWPQPRLPVRRKLLLAWAGDAVALLRTWRHLKTPLPRNHRGHHHRGGGWVATTRRLTSATMDADALDEGVVMNATPDTVALPLRAADDALVLCSRGITAVLSDKARNDGDVAA
jgi:hypothetical protein